MCYFALPAPASKSHPRQLDGSNSLKLGAFPLLPEWIGPTKSEKPRKNGCGAFLLSRLPFQHSCPSGRTNQARPSTLLHPHWPTFSQRQIECVAGVHTLRAASSSGLRWKVSMGPNKLECHVEPGSQKKGCSPPKAYDSRIQSYYALSIIQQSSKLYFRAIHHVTRQRTNDSAT